MNQLVARLYRECPSIHAILRKFYRAITLLMLVPILILLLTLVMMAWQYNHLISNISDAAAIRERVQVGLPGEIWDIVAGKKSFDQGDPYRMIDEVELGLDSLEGYNRNATQYLSATRWSSQTLRLYVDLLREQMEDRVAVSINENTYREITSVTTLMDSLLQQYINEGNASMAGINRGIFTVAIGVALLVVLLLALVYQFAMGSFRSVGVLIHNPILELERMTARITGGDLDARAGACRVRELESLTTGLNEMASRLQQLIDEQIRVGEVLQKAEMRALQEQIQPHFVYNSFETIVWLAEQERCGEVVEITMALTEFFRIALNSGMDYMTVALEEQHVRSYLTIQSVRYSIMTYDVEIDPTLSGFVILKLLLQPLVENAIYHGIKKKRARGHILVTGTREEDGQMTFRVSDDGVGITGERLEKIRRKLSEAVEVGEEAVGFGLFNVHRRIRLYYRSEGLRIESAPGKGTSVSFTIPCLEKGGPPHAETVCR